MSEIKIGDRFRVTLEGEARYVGRDGRTADVTLFVDGRKLQVGSLPLAGAEKIIEPLKVGDTIEGEDAYEALPLGAVLDASLGANVALFRTNAGFTDAHGNTYGPLAFYCPRRVAYLPA